MKPKILLLVLLSLAIALPAAFGQSLMQLWDAEHSAPISSTNPLQVTGVGGTTSNVTLLQSSAVVTRANPIFSAPAGTTIANTTSLNGTVGAVAATVNLTAASYHLKVRNTHGSNTLYLALTGVATNGKYPIPPGDEEDIYLAAPISSVSVIGSGAGTTYGIMAY